eukprot:g19520.t1
MCGGAGKSFLRPEQNFSYITVLTSPNISHIAANKLAGLPGWQVANLEVAGFVPTLMGICSSSQSRATAPLDSAGRQVRLLMLGTGAAGKSTFLRQLQLLYQDGFSPEERANFRESLRQNALESIQVLIRGVNTMRIPWRTEDAKEAAQRVYEVKPFRDDYFTPNLVQDIKILWKEVAIQLAYKNRSKLQLPEMCEYYLTSIMRIGAANYVPTDEDIVRARIKSTGIAERKIMINKVLFTFIDVGGQRSERRKWVQCFSGGAVTAIFYMASINEYDQFLLEDTRTNRLHEALGVFEALINNAIFRDTAVILFMNKKGTARFAPSIPTWGKEFQRHAVRSGSTRGHPYLMMCIVRSS